MELPEELLELTRCARAQSPSRPFVTLSRSRLTRVVGLFLSQGVDPDSWGISSSDGLQSAGGQIISLDRQRRRCA